MSVLRSSITRSKVQRRCLLLAYLVFTGVLAGGCERDKIVGFPYDAAADPNAALASNTQIALTQGKSILLIFGANWCEDCRRLSRVMRDNTVQPTIEEHFVVMHIDVGNWDHNTEFVEAWGNPIAGGIPAVVVANTEHEVIYKTAPGELASARLKGLAELRAAFEHMAMLHMAYKEDIPE